MLKIEGDAKSVRNTCSFDSVIQIIQFGVIDYLQYKSAIEASKNKALQFVVKFLKNGPTTDILKDRTLILNEIFPSIINARDTIRGAWTKLFFNMNPNEPSGYKTHMCSNSNCKGSSIQLPVLSINNRIIEQCNGFNALEKALQYSPKRYNMKCLIPKCHGLTVEETTLNMHIFIETDVNIGVESKFRRCCQLAEFPVTLNLGKQYMYDKINCYTYGILFRVNNYAKYFFQVNRSNWFPAGSLHRILP